MPNDSETIDPGNSQHSKSRRLLFLLGIIGVSAIMLALITTGTNSSQSDDWTITGSAMYTPPHYYLGQWIQPSDDGSESDILSAIRRSNDLVRAARRPALTLACVVSVPTSNTIMLIWVVDLTQPIAVTDNLYPDPTLFLPDMEHEITRLLDGDLYYSNTIDLRHIPSQAPFVPDPVSRQILAAHMQLRHNAAKITIIPTFLRGDFSGQTLDSSNAITLDESALTNILSSRYRSVLNRPMRFNVVFAEYEASNTPRVPLFIRPVSEMP